MRSSIALLLLLLTAPALARQPAMHLPVSHTAAVTHACFTPGGRRPIAASEDDTARIWDAQTSYLDIQAAIAPIPLTTSHYQENCMILMNRTSFRMYI